MHTDTVEPSDPDRPWTACVVVAAGSGRRMGAGRNKVLLEISGEPILLHTLRHLVESKRLDEIVVVCREDDEVEFRGLVSSIPSSPPIRFARGGKERDDSVASGLRSVDPSARIVLVHDGARPFVSARLVRDLVAAAMRHGAAIPVIPIADTVKRVAAGRIEGTLDRSELAGAQTPQAFRSSDLAAVRSSTRDGESRSPTDDASLFELDGRPVAAVTGDPWNVKLTTPDDLALAPALLAAFRAREARLAATETK